MVAGRAACVTGLASAGADEIRVHPWTVARALRLEDADLLEARLSAVGAQRRLVVRGREVEERLYVPRDAPLVLAEWQAAPQPEGSAPCHDPLDLSIAWSLGAGGAAAAAPVPGGRAFGVRLPDGAAAALVSSVAPASWTADSLLVRLLPGEIFRLAFTAGADEASLAASVATLRSVESLVPARAAALRRQAAEGAGVDAPDPFVGQVLAAAVERLDGFLLAIPGGGACLVDGYGGAAPEIVTPTAAAAGIALLAGGCFDPALDALRFLGERLDAAGLPPSRVALKGSARPGGLEDAAAYLRLASHALDWTGDSALIGDEWPRVRRALAALLADLEGGAAPPRRLLEALSAAARTLGDAATVDALAAALRRPGSAPESRHIPDAGLSAFMEGRTRAGLRAWRAAAGAGAGVPPALWPGDGGRADAAAPAAALVASLLLGWLGADPDASRHRLRLRPQVPEDRAGFEARVRVGASRVRLRHTAEDRLHRFEIEQQTGALPLRAVLEPVLPDSRLRAVRIDGAPAELDPRRFGDGLLVPVQLMLDHARMVEIEVEDATDLPGVPPTIQDFR